MVATDSLILKKKKKKVGIDSAIPAGLEVVWIMSFSR